jgi:hypothetical protein
MATLSRPPGQKKCQKRKRQENFSQDDSSVIEILIIIGLQINCIVLVTYIFNPQNWDIASAIQRVHAKREQPQKAICHIAEAATLSLAHVVTTSVMYDARK